LFFLAFLSQDNSAAQLNIHVSEFSIVVFTRSQALSPDNHLNVFTPFLTLSIDRKATPATYERHINHYVDWWTSYQAAEINGDSTKTVIPAFPIMAAKATMFLDYTSTSAKVSSFEKKKKTSSCFF
jgi:hypothetical protein